MKTKEEILIDYMANAGCLEREEITEDLDEPWFVESVKAMQAYADQQVNKVLDEAIQRVNNLKYIENFALSESLYDQCLNMLESLKIKQP